MPTLGLEGVADPKMMMIGLLYNEAQHDAKVVQTTLTYILTVHRNEEIPVPDVSGLHVLTCISDVDKFD